MADPERYERIVQWLAVEVAYLRLCEFQGWDPGLYDPENHSTETTRDIVRFCREIGGVDVAVRALFGDEVSEARTWFRVLAGEAEA